MNNKSEEDYPEENRNGNCFEYAYKAVVLNRQYSLVHGIVTGEGKLKGVKFVHAWCEFDGMCYDSTANVAMPKKLYYEKGKIEHTVAYTMDEAFELVIHTETYGYWHPIFDELDHIQRKK